MDAAGLQTVYKESVDHLNGTGYTADLESFIERQKQLLERFGTSQPVRALCLGLGPLSREKTQAIASCAQLHIFNSMLDNFGIKRSNASVHDPAFDEVDKDFVQSFDLRIPTSPGEALEDLICRSPTLVFLPFLPFPVIELFLAQNWSPDLLRNVMIVGNGYRGWLDDPFWKRSVTDLAVEKSYIPRLDRCMSLLECTKMPRLAIPDDRRDDAEKDHRGVAAGLLSRDVNINTFEFQWLPVNRVYALGAAFWKVTPIENWKQKHAHDPDSKAKDEIKAKL